MTREQVLDAIDSQNDLINQHFEEVWKAIENKARLHEILTEIELKEKRLPLVSI